MKLFESFRQLFSSKSNPIQHHHLERLYKDFAECKDVMNKTQAELGYEGCKTECKPRKLVLFVCDLRFGFNRNMSRFPYTWPTIINKELDVVYGVICMHPFKNQYYSGNKDEFLHFLGTLQCMDFVIEVSNNDKFCYVNYQKITVTSAALIANIAQYGLQPDFANENVRFIHCKCEQCKFENVVVIQSGCEYPDFSYSNEETATLHIIAEIINRCTTLPNERTLLLDVGIYRPELHSCYYFDLHGDSTYCIAYGRYADFCQLLVDRYLEKIKACLHELLEDSTDLPQSTFTNDIQPMRPYHLIP